MLKEHCDIPSETITRMDAGAEPTGMYSRRVSEVTMESVSQS